MNARAIKVALRQDFLSQPILMQLQVALITIGALFWVEASLRPEAFSADIYGGLALSLPAEVWAALMMAPAAMCWVGLRHPIKRWMVAVGATIQTVQFLVLAYSAIATGGEPIIGLFGSVLFAPLHARMAVEAARNA